MGRKWIKTSFPNVRYREHETRRHGVRPDRYYSVRYRLKGRDREEGVGWSSEGMTAQRADEILASLRQAQREGGKAVTLGERRELAAQERERRAATGITLGALWETDYAPQARARLKAKSYRREEQLFRLHIEPLMGSRVVRELDDRAVESLMDHMRATGQSPRSIEYGLGVFNRLWKLALRRGIVDAECPVKRVPRPKVVNTRLRCFTPEELRGVLETVQIRDGDAYDLCLFAALTGCRFSEAAALKWEHVDLIREAAMFAQTKNRDPREVFLAPPLVEMLERRGPGQTGEPVFSMGNGEPWRDIPYAFRASVEPLNEGRGRRERLTFHSLRHSAATFAARRGVPVKDLQIMFGWRTPAMVFRYAKGSDDIQRRAARGLAQALLGVEGKVLELPVRKAGGEGKSHA